MAYDYTADNLIQLTRDVANVGSSQQDWDNNRMLRLLNRQVQEYLVPFVARVRREYFVTFADQPLVASQAAYYIPSAATVDKIRAVHLVDGSGQPFSRLIELPLEQAINIGSNSLAGPLPQGIPQGYYFRGNQMVLVPIPSAAAPYTLRTYYAARPSVLTLQASAVQVTGFPGGAAGGRFRLSVGTVPSTFSTSAPCDLVLNSPGFDVVFTGTPTAVVGGSYIELPGTQPPALSIGDWICLAGSAPVVTGAPAEVVLGCLVNKMAVEILASKGKGAEVELRAELLRKSEEEAKALLLSRRNEGDHQRAGSGSLYRFRRSASTLALP